LSIGPWSIPASGSKIVTREPSNTRLFDILDSKFDLRLDIRPIYEPYDGGLLASKYDALDGCL
jgi:hypothetical protein